MHTRVLALLLWLIVPAAFAQSANESLYRYNGPDRQARLQQQAKKE